MFVDVDRLAGDRRHLQRLLEPLTADQFHDDSVAVHNDERRGHHGENHAGQYGVQQGRWNQRIGLGEGQQHKTEFARLGKVKPGPQ